MLSSLLIAAGLRSLAKVLKEDKPSRAKAITIALLIFLLLTVISALLWAVGAI